MIVFPAIDIIDGKIVRLEKGEIGSVKSYSDDPVEVAKAFEDGGLEHLHVVDLDRAFKRGCNLRVIEKIARSTSLSVDAGGGVRSEDDYISFLNAGAKKVNIGSLAVEKREDILSWARKMPGSIILSADLSEGYVALSGWREKSRIEGIPFIKGYVESGLRYATVTDIARDGMLSGPSTDLYKKIRHVTNFGDFCRLASNYTHPYAIYEYLLPDRTEAVVFVLGASIQFSDKIPPIRVPGLLPDAVYTVTCYGNRVQTNDYSASVREYRDLSGLGAANAGIRVELLGDYDCRILHFQLRK